MGEGRLRRETVEGFPLFVSGGARADASAATPGEGRLRRETVEGFPLFVSGGARADASAATPGEGRLRRETVEGFPLFVSDEARAGGERRSSTAHERHRAVSRDGAARPRE